MPNTFIYNKNLYKTFLYNTVIIIIKITNVHQNLITTKYLITIINNYAYLQRHLLNIYATYNTPIVQNALSAIELVTFHLIIFALVWINTLY